MNAMIIEVTLENRLTFYQGFVDRSIRDWYVPDADIDTICRHSFSVSELDIDLIDKFTILELCKAIIKNVNGDAFALSSKVLCIQAFN